MTDALTLNAERRSQAFKVAAFIVFVGPIAGLVPLLALALTRMPVGYPLTAESLQGVAVVLLFVVLYAYIFAGIPCLIAAAWLGRMTYRNGTFGWLTAAGAAMVSTLLGGVALGYLAAPENAATLHLRCSCCPSRSSRRLFAAI